MKQFLFLAVVMLSFTQCKREPEFFIDGVGYYTNKVCIESHAETRYEYHYGYNVISRKYEYHYGYNTVIICDQYRIDTIKCEP